MCLTRAHFLPSLRTTPLPIAKPAREAAKQLCKQRYIEFGCEGRAASIKGHSLQVVAGQYARGELSQVVQDMAPA